MVDVIFISSMPSPQIAESLENWQIRFVNLVYHNMDVSFKGNESNNVKQMFNITTSLS